jgi:tetratricopeptide (TPR) repeat protein
MDQGMEMHKEALCLLERYEFQAAFSKANDSYRRMEEYFGPNHIYTAESMIKLSQICNLIGYYEQAYIHSARAVLLLKLSHDVHRPLLASSLSILSESLVNVGLYPQSLVAEEEAFELKERLFGEKNILTVASHISVGDRYRLIGNLAKADKILIQCLTDYKPSDAKLIQFPESLIRISPYTPLVVLSLEKSEYDKAQCYIGKEIHEVESQDPRKKLPIWGQIYNLLAEIELREKKDYEGALKSLEDASEFYISTFGTHPELSKTWTYMAECYLETGNPEQAKATLLKAINNFEKFIEDKTHPRYLMMKIRLGLSMRSTEDSRGAQRLIEESLHKLWRKLGPNHPKSVYYYDLAAQYDTKPKGQLKHTNQTGRH